MEDTHLLNSVHMLREIQRDFDQWFDPWESSAIGLPVPQPDALAALEAEAASRKLDLEHWHVLCQRFHSADLPTCPREMCIYCEKEHIVPVNKFHAKHMDCIKPEGAFK
jgi:hypothetical protein